MNVEVSFVGLPVRGRPSTRQSVAQQTDRHWYVSMREGSTVGDLIKRLGLPDEEIDLVLVNGQRADRHAVLQEGDAVAFTGQVTGD